MDEWVKAKSECRNSFVSRTQTRAHTLALWQVSVILHLTNLSACFSKIGQPDSESWDAHTHQTVRKGHIKAQPMMVVDAEFAKLLLHSLIFHALDS